MAYTKKRMTAFLPSTPCTQEMRDRLVKLAEREGKSVAELQRNAIALFLSRSAIGNSTHEIEASNLGERAS